MSIHYIEIIPHVVYTIPHEYLKAHLVITTECSLFLICFVALQLTLQQLYNSYPMSLLYIHPSLHLSPYRATDLK